MLDLMLNTAGFVLVCAIAVHSVVLHVRLSRLRRALAEAGKLLPRLDASALHMAEVTGEFTQRLQADLQTVDGRVAAARRLGGELAAANRAAEESSAHLERLLRQHRRMDGARPEPIPRELVEPRGFAERAGLAQAATGASGKARATRNSETAGSDLRAGVA